MARIIVTKKRTLIDAEILATSEAAAKLRSRCKAARLPAQKVALSDCS
jgi:hypothetical protein